MLRLLGRRRAGNPLTDTENKRLDSWLDMLHEARAVVAYDPDSDEGFVYVDATRHELTKDIPIRKNRVYLNP